MSSEDKINMDFFKVVTKAVAESDNLDIMVNHLSQLLVAALEIKGCTIFALNQETEELEVLASFGLSINYLGKGPIRADRSIGCTLRGEPVVITDVTRSDRLQYPEEARKEGIAAIVSMPITFSGDVIGVLRLYHNQIWDISERDVDSLLILGENIGLSLMYGRLLNTLQFMKEAFNNLPKNLIPL